jgi:hypothetical protein
MTVTVARNIPGIAPTTIPAPRRRSEEAICADIVAFCVTAMTETDETDDGITVGVRIAPPMTVTMTTVETTTVKRTDGATINRTSPLFPPRHAGLLGKERGKLGRFDVTVCTAVAVPCIIAGDTPSSNG